MKLRNLTYSRKWLWTSIIVVLLIGSAMSALAEINSTGTYFEVIPIRNIVQPLGSTFTIDINVNNAPANDIRAWGLTLEWNKTVLNILNVQEGPFLSSVSTTTFVFESLVTAQAKGSIGISCSILGDPAILAGGSGKLCNVTFSVIGAWRSKLNLKDTRLINRATVAKDYPNNDGYFCETTAFTCLHDVYVVLVETNVTQVQQGDQVGITVLIHNEGNHPQVVNVIVYADLVTHDPKDPDTVMVGDELVVGSVSALPITPCTYIPLTFDWDTTNVAGEKWTISAEVVKLDAPDDDLHDNLFLGPVVHVTSVHDLKVTDVTVLTTTVSKNNVMNFTGPGKPIVPVPIVAIVPGGRYNVLKTAQMDGLYATSPVPCSWWRILMSSPTEPLILGLEFHVGYSFPNGTFIIDQVVPAPVVGINVLWIIAERTAKVRVTVVNEGKVPETFDVNVYANKSVETYLIGTKTVNNLAVNGTATLYFHWSLPGSCTVPPSGGKYNVRAYIPPVAGEEPKNWPDNTKWAADTIEVQYFDIAVVKIELLIKCYPGGFNPIAVPRITLVNLGCNPGKVVVYYIAIDQGPTSPGTQIVFGVGIIGPIAPGAMMSFDGCSPYGGWHRMLPGITPGAPVPVIGDNYLIVASTTPAPGYRDDNMANNKNLWGPWNLANIADDVQVTKLSRGYNPKIGITPTDEVYYGQSLCVNINVTNQGQISNDVNVNLFYRDPAQTIGFTDADGNITLLAPCIWYKNTSGSVPPDTWWHIKSPPSLYSIEFHVDTSNATHFHIDIVKVSGNSTQVEIPNGVSEIAAEREVLCGTKAVTIAAGVSTIVKIGVPTDVYDPGTIPGTKGLYLVAQIHKVTGTDQDPCDNKLTLFVSFRVRPYCDVDADGGVSGGDIGTIGIWLWTLPFTLPIHYWCDVNNDGEINGADSGTAGIYLWTVDVMPVVYRMPC